MTTIHSIAVSPPLINSSCAWASDFAQLQELYESPYTGAVTTRTATWEGFKENEAHTVVFTSDSMTSLNSYGYSPHPLLSYFTWIRTLLSRARTKPFIISITSSSPEELDLMVDAIQKFRFELSDIPHSSSPSTSQPSCQIAIELNTSCPNMGPSYPPPSYTPSLLKPLLTVLAAHYNTDPSLTIGLKLPPFVYRGQFDALLDCVHSFTVRDGEEERNPFAFFTCTNTLGNSLLFSSQTSLPSSPSSTRFALPTALGGLAGASIHALSLGNVYTFSSLLSSHASPAIRAIKIIGVGGVSDGEGVKRMKAAGASVVACASALGREGVRVFERLFEEAGTECA